MYAQTIVTLNINTIFNVLHYSFNSLRMPNLIDEKGEM